MQKILINFWWVVLWCLIVLTNSHIEPSDLLTTASAMDTSQYLRIAEAAPGLPAQGSNLIFHGAQRILFPYLAGLLANLVGQTPWTMFQGIVHLMTFLTALIFWKTTQRVTKGNFHLSSILTTLLICHPFLFRLELTFSGFFNDAIFNLGLCIFAHGIVYGSKRAKCLGLLIMIPAKQTALLVIPAMMAVEFVTGEPSKKEAFKFWLPILFLAALYYTIVSSIIYPFCVYNTTSDMAFGLVHWIENASNINDFVQLLEFIGRGILGLLPPVAVICGAVFAGRQIRALWSDKRMFVLFLSSIAQPLISGPAVTGASIQRLLSLGLIPLLLCLAALLQGLKFKGPRALVAIFCASFLGSFHHLFSKIGPDPGLRSWFFVLYFFGSSLVGLLIYATLCGHPISTHENHKDS